MAAKKVGELVKEARTAAGLTQEKLAKTAGEKLTAADISKCERGEADLTAAQLKKIAVACGVSQTSLVNAPKNLSAAAAKKAAAKTATSKPAAAKAAAAKTTAAKATAKTTAAKATAAKPAAKATAAKATAAKPAAKATAAKTTAAKATAKTTTAKATTAKPAAKKTAAPKTPANANTSMKVTAAEKKLIEAYRNASSDRKKAALKLLNGEYGDTVDKILSVTNGVSGSPSASSGGNPADAIGDVLGNLLGGLLGGK